MQQKVLALRGACWLSTSGPDAGSPVEHEYGAYLADVENIHNVMTSKQSAV